MYLYPKLENTAMKNKEVRNELDKNKQEEMGQTGQHQEQKI